MFSSDNSKLIIYSSDGQVFTFDYEGKTINTMALGYELRILLAHSDGSILASMDYEKLYIYKENVLISSQLLPFNPRAVFKNDEIQKLALYCTYPSPKHIIYRYDGQLMSEIEFARPIRGIRFMGNSIIGGTSQELFMMDYSEVPRLHQGVR
jgi:hypothetical protein